MSSKSDNNTMGFKIECDADETIEKLEKIKALLTDIQELDKNFTLSNVIEAKENTVLIFNTDMLLKKDNAISIEDMLREKTGLRCILTHRLSLQCALEYGIDKAEEKDYTITSLYDVDGNIIERRITDRND